MSEEHSNKRRRDYFFVELIDVERGLVLGLNEDGVLLELLGSGHGG